MTFGQNDEAIAEFMSVAKSKMSFSECRWSIVQYLDPRLKNIISLSKGKKLIY